MRAITLFTRLTFKEILRSRTYGFLLLFSLLSSASGQLFLNFTLQEQEKFLKDIGMASVTFFSILLSVILGSTQIYNDFENKQIYSLLINPLRLYEYLVGRFLGFIFLIALAMGLMGLVLYASLIVQNLLFQMNNISLEIDIRQAFFFSIQKGLLANLPLLKGFAALFFQSILLCSVALLLSCFVSQSFAVIASFLILLAGHLVNLVIPLSFQYHKMLGHLMTFLLLWMPNFENFNITDSVVLGQNIPPVYFLWLSLYTVLGVSLFLFISHRVLFQKTGEL
ncbi:MAG: hypothetical protein HYS08_05465 [Chlamydiae bacterium]|nr:hypothetical protein [Chlamydiota bacterium]MBI3267165.1 hypothetical protein [Chlamydiota bacterium]